METFCCSDKCEKRLWCANHSLNNEGTHCVEDYSSFGAGACTNNGCEIEYWCGKEGNYKMFEPVVIKSKEWTPCNVGLPEYHLIRDVFNRPQGYMSDSVLVTVKSNECDGVRYFVSTDYMKGATQEDVKWMMSCGYGGSAVYNQEIIAWMYKPDPYKEV